MDNTVQLGISVIICTYNGALQLPQTLKHLAAQEVPAEINWEIIIVDNASTDETATVARAEWQQYDLPNVGFVVVNESYAGKYHALTTGVNSAQYEYIVICDDDNWLSNNYVSQAYNGINSNTRFAAIGGQGIAVADIEIPDWFWQHQNGYAVGSPAVVSGDVSAKGYLWGAGMVFRRSLYKKVNNSLPAILPGPSPTAPGRGEDVELCMRFLLAGYMLYYCEKLKFWHHMNASRLTESYRDDFLHLSKYEDHILNLYRKQIGINNLSALKKTLLLVESWLRYLACKMFPGIKKWYYGHEAEVIYMLIGVKLAGVSDEAIRVRKLNISLSKKAVA